MTISRHPADDRSGQIDRVIVLRLSSNAPADSMLRFDRVTTQRLVLRRWQPGDLDSFAALNSDPEVMRHFPSTYRPRSATAAMTTAWEAKFDRQGFGLWAVERAEDGVLLGMAGLNPVPPGIITGEGLEIGRRFARPPGATATRPRPAKPP